MKGQTAAPVVFLVFCAAIIEAVPGIDRVSSEEASRVFLAEHYLRKPVIVAPPPDGKKGFQQLWNLDDLKTRYGSYEVKVGSSSSIIERNGDGTDEMRFDRFLEEGDSPQRPAVNDDDDGKGSGAMLSAGLYLFDRDDFLQTTV
jgi:hypothetical protein